MLIKRMATANLWGAPRIHVELLKLGIQISEATVSKYMPRRGKPPSHSWRSFLANHVSVLVSVDFFTVPTFCFEAVFVFVVLAHTLSAGKTTKTCHEVPEPVAGGRSCLSGPRDRQSGGPVQSPNSAIGAHCAATEIRSA